MNAPIVTNSCAACACPRSWHPAKGVGACASFREQHVICGCDCQCRVPLTEGNVMREDLTAELVGMEEASEPDTPRVVQLICIGCYTGAHRRQR